MHTKCLNQIILLLCFLNSFAQFQGIKVTYKEFFDTYRPVERSAFLYTTSNFSIFEEDYSTDKDLSKKTDLNLSSEIIVYKPAVQENNIIMSDFNKNKIETFGYLYLENKSKIIDYYMLNWKLIDEKQVIDKIECYKATVNFRGRKWIAWYAPSIPYPSGPMKFNGLPGLIIKINDETNKYNYVVEKIEFLKEDIYNQKMTEIKNIPFNQQQTLQEFVLQREEVLENSLNSNNDNRNIEVQRIKMPRNGIELKYEWEE